MVNGLILASYTYFEGSGIGDMLNVWQEAGFFEYLLPFLLIFALVFGILRQIKLFEHDKAINAIIALVVGIMALQFEMVPQFFSEIFPRLGVGLAIILVILILGGLFFPREEKGFAYTLLGVGVVIAIVVLVQTAGAVGWSSGYWWQDNWKLVAGVIFILAAIAIIVGGSKATTEPFKGFWLGEGVKKP